MGSAPCVKVICKEGAALTAVLAVGAFSDYGIMVVGYGIFDMFDVHLDRNTVIKIPQISKEKLNQEENKQGPKRKGLLGWLFGK